ncbi:PREDICTED: uncharacterized protein LOC109472514 [Branchiostoma belcheri]|uniref:Metalloendopeptidase n=1 Tax=Branchiostoma belcheri TaxID=7741 RepID=A0A6P4Z1P4_BRABE|nr:PREDICTED: uncharacterized protein LOC109472514 [Branchiostoma belcheri]
MGKWPVIVAAILLAVSTTVTGKPFSLLEDVLRLPERENAMSDIFAANEGAMERLNLVEGDIRMPEDEGPHRLHKRNAVPYKDNTWTNKVVPISVSPDLPPAAHIAVQEAIDEYHKKTCIRFKQRTNEQEYIQVFKGEGCWSYIGRVGSQPNRISLDSGCETKGIAVHEFMHALGFWHEQSRYDRDNFVTIYLDNVKPGRNGEKDYYYGNFDRLTRINSQTLDTTYDYHSVMHYPTDAFGKSGKITIEPRLGEANFKWLGQRNGLSDIDTLKINRLYECDMVVCTDQPDVFACQQKCVKLKDGFTCGCHRGFSLDSDGYHCSDINECAKENFGCSHRCVNLIGGAYCACPKGHHLRDDGKTCTETNECAQGNGGCEHLCTDTPGAFECSCYDGFKLRRDGYTCKDVDECASRDHGCQQECANYVGGYHCACQEGYVLQRDGTTCEEIHCYGLAAPGGGSVDPAENCSTNGARAGQRCTFSCDPGYELVGSENRTCLINGSWEGEHADCRAKLCDVLTPPSNGSLSPPSCADPGALRVGKECVYVCGPGLVLNGTAHRVTCTPGHNGTMGWGTPGPNGTMVWDNLDTPTCIPDRLTCTPGHNGPMVWGTPGPNGTMGWDNLGAPACIPDEDPWMQCPHRLHVSTSPGRDYATANLTAPLTNLQQIFVDGNLTLGPNNFSVGETPVLFYGYSAGVERIECETAVVVTDDEHPEFVSCPESFEVNSSRQFPHVHWEKPEVRDNVGIAAVRRSRFPKGRMTWGQYSVRYTARDQAGNHAVCRFNIHVKKPACPPLPSPDHGSLTCDWWRLGQFCDLTCSDGYTPQGALFRYVCGTQGTWMPRTPLPTCLPI